MDIKNNTVIKVISSTITSGNTTITDYEWYLDNIKTSYISASPEMVISTTLGTHTISGKVKNSCGKWSNIYYQTINILEGEIMEKTETVVVNQPTVTVAIILPYTGAAEVTVTDGVNPVVGATLDLDGVPTGLSTGVDGKASIPNVPYGTHTVKAIKL